MTKKHEIQDIYPLSYMQEGMLFHTLLNKDTQAYVEQASFSMTGKVDTDIFQKSITALCARHDIFRTIFISQNVSVPQQVVLKERTITVEEKDLTHLDRSGQLRLIDDVKKTDRAKGFHLQKDGLMRVILFKTGEREFTCIWSFHHIIMDGWCLGIVLKEFFHIYASHLHQTPLKLEPAVPYGSYIQWLMEQDKEAAARYWEGYLEGYDQQSRLPQQKKAGAKSRQEEVTFSLSKTVTDKLKELAAKEEVTLSTIFHTLWGMLLQAYNQTDDAVFGSVISGRPAEIAGIERMIGLFINTVPVRVTGTKVPFVKLIKQVQKDALNGQPYSYHPLYEIQAESAVKQGLIDHILVFENYPVEKEIALLNSGQDAEDLFRIHDFNMEDETNYSFYLMVAPGENIHLKMRFDSGIHERSFIESVKGHLQHIIAQVLENPNLTPEELTITTQQEQKDLLSTLKIETKQREYETIQSMFERQAAQSPDEKAIHYEGQSITYKELNEMANKLARLLRKRGVKRQEPVAIMVERSPALAAGVLGILKAGAAFVPIDLSHPAERIRYCIENSGCQHIVSQHHVAALAKSAATKRSVTFIEEADAESDGSNVETVNTAEDLLYIMYTSGTTGKPKGVLFEHRNMANLLHDQFENSRIDFKTNVLQYASCAFDVCYQELFTTLLSGGTLCIAPESIKRDPAQLFLLINTQRTEVVFFPTAFVKMLFNEEHYANHFPNCVKHVITAGEQLTVSHIFKALLKRHGIHLHNHYGPAETHVVSTCTIHPEGDIPDSPPIGKPISHNAMYILDKYKRLQPCGVAGELYISGASVGRGYVNNPILTKQKFLPDPFRAGAVMYRTGDIARLRADGQMDYIGRTDDQVKIRGYRVEPKEIEVTLANHPAVKEAVVLVQKDSEGEHELCAYYSTRKPIDPSALRHDLADAIPDYMMPVKWTAVPAIPLTANGKVDKSALPEPTSSASHQSYAAPRNLNELRLSQLWEGLLKRGPVGIRDNFFELGGHSLKATSLISRIAKEWNVQIPLSDVFAHPTVEGLAAVISETEENPFASIQQIEKKESYPVSSAQKRMYVLHQLDGGGVSYNIPAVLELTGELDQQRVEAVFRELIRRHEPLRTSFEAGDDGEPVQRIHEKVPFAFSNESSSESFIRPFDLGKAPLFRAGLATIEKGRYLLLVDMHHIISDGVSIQLLMQEFSELYKGLELAPLRIQYKDYAAWQETFKTSDIYKRQESYWLKQLAGELPVLELPTDKPRPPAKSFAGDRVTFEISQELTSRLQQLAGENSCTLYMTLLGIYTVLLSRLSGQEEIIVGSPIAGRPHADLESVLGMFVNTLAFRTRPVSGISFKQYLQDIRETALEAYEHQDYPLEKLVDRLGVQREMSRNPLFDTTFALQNMERQQLSMEGLELRQKDISHPISKFDLSLYMAESGGQIYCQFEYSTDLFERKTIQKWADFFKTLAKNAAQHPELELDHLSILSKKEESALLQNFSPMQKIDFPLDQPLHHQLEQQAEKTPDRPAVLADGVSISYRELNERANQIAWKLIGLGIQQEDVIAVMGRRSPDMLIGIYGILKAGAAYVPIDPDYPEERIRFLMKDSGAKTLLAESNPSMFEGTILPLDGGRGNHGEAAVNPNLPVPPDALAYIIYTSGSTGRPKGVMVEHRSAVNFLYSLQTRYSLNDSDIILHKTSYSFDASIWELFWWPFAGASVYLLPQGGEKDPEIILKALEEKEVTAAHFVPSMLHSFLEYMNQRKKPADIRHLKRVFAGGEQLGAHLVSRFHELLPRVELTNSYGPTEATVEAAYFDVPKRKTLDHVPIGRSGHNMRLYILNKKRQLLPFGCRGELYIAGAGVARGYLNRPELTEERFLDDPFYSGERMYQTGDLARWLPDGTVEWLGRMDGQVKIRGYRIEPGEVEAVLRQIDGVREAAVIARTEGEETELCAYIEGQDQQTVRTELRKRLPAYMMPSAFIEMREWPVTPSGKLDRKALPAPDGAAERRAYTAPQTITEMKLAKLWEEVLKYGPAGIRDHFFEQGGHSLKATALVSRIAKAFGVQVPLKEIFAKPTLEELAAVIQELDESPHAAIEPADKQDTYPVSSAQKRMYVLQQLEDGGVGYNMPAALKLTGPLDRARLDEVFRQLIRRHESLRTSFETGADGEPVQRIHDDVPFQLMELAAAEDFVRPFRLQEAPLFRAALVKEAEESHLLLVDMHHIISDGVSVGTLISEFSELYANRMLASLRIQYKDYAVWQQAFKQGEAYNRQETYWLKQLDGELPVLELPADNARPAVRSFAGDHVSFSLDADTSSGLYKIARDNGCTLYMVLLAAYSTLLSRLSGQEDIIIGSPIAGRPHKDLEPVIGMFVNTLAIRTQPAENKCFSDFLREVRETALEAFEHQDYPFEELVDRLNVVRDMSRNPLFDAMLVVQNMDRQELFLDGLHIQPADMPQTGAKFDLTLQVSEGDERIHFRFEYASSLFKQDTIERWASHFTTMLQHIVHAPQTALPAISMLTAKEQQLLMTNFNRMPEQHGPNITVHELFARQAAKSPSATALITREGVLTYQELDEWSNKIARTLQNQGIGPDLTVGIMIPKSTGLIAAVLGTWKAGGAYVPLDLGYPDERKQYVLADSGAKLLITDKKTIHQVPDDFKGEVLLIEDVQEQDTSPILTASGPDHLAYIIYTSGTTGNPKGVMVEHRGVAYTVQWRSAFYEFHDHDIALQLSSFSFDAFVTSMFAPLISGVQTVIPAEEEAKDILAIKQYLADYGITHMNLVPILYRTLLDVLQPEDVQALRLVTLGGEAIEPNLLERSFSLRPDIEISNEYGPTESSITATAARRLKREENITIGRPIGYTNVYILKGDHLQPIGVTGELCITGPGLARGYINLPEQTAKAFVQDPFHPDQRMYRTGDLAKWLPDGTLQYVGRMDEQVKIRGYRIEIKEVEAALSGLAVVKEAAVVDSVTAAGHKELCAYIVVEDGADCGMVRKALAKKVPSYMVPAFFQTLDALPTMPNGKLNKPALAKIPHKGETRQTFTAPATDIEKELAAIWRGVLGVDKIGIDESFFELGGDSIKALQVSARLHQSGKQLAVKDIFSHPTIQELAPYVRLSQQPISQASVEGEMTWSPVQKWFLSQDIKEAHHFNQSVMLHRSNPLDEDALRKTLKAITVHHDALRLICVKDEQGNLRLYNRPANIGEDQLYNLRIFNLAGEPKDHEHIIKHQVRELQKAMDLENGPLVQVGLFRSSEGDDLFLAIHHLAVDGISWRIILEDLASVYEQAIRGDDIALPPKTASFQTYTEQLAKYAESRRLLQQADYWRAIEQHETVALPKDQTHIDKTALKKRNTVSFTLAQQETDAILKDVHNAYNTDTQDLLLASAALAIWQWVPQKALKIALEGHGRQSEAAHHDISRTVGWFTSIYPVLLQLEPNTWDDHHEEYMIRALKITKDTLRRIPDKGFGYGVLKYMTPPEKAKIKFGKAPDITFNYLGQFEIGNRAQTETEQLDAFTFSPLGGGEDITGTWKREQSLDISALVAEGKLTVNMTYETGRFQKETIERLSQDCQYYLRKLMNHCLGKTETEKTVSDFDDRELTEEAFKNITDLLGFH
ncbi:non-ribosomal peptide synthetase [Bacillus paralicheniformis]|uniref:non-ribosomal peptide synthetase n=1 Tax=Bacillus paralicheniformis TaxID=1648923 RepID=UPI000F6EF9B2|nr:non-ribosomal peptide synthetase [Bacillus paralicheniformis]MDE1363502.1 non-ribosomal peptide synthetase [Bacillus paralicheniformis]MEC2322057.1 non-ribosomal peptide synthetase [Bacillus paralicheniformis]MED4310446.1 non-ribosomal peptide synthetase [Bacillus paralicheniformis]MED4349931.1 non-ribosomal peptide synthetase [Bacillus paralicheniformis]WEA73462.1 non-ribosomal peptide synthetase [Bacillus paralicheniformis]